MPRFLTVSSDCHAGLRPEAYRDYLAKHDELLARAFAGKLLTFATGRELGFSDRAELDRIVAATARNKHRLRDLLHRIIKSEIFLNK